MRKWAAGLNYRLLTSDSGRGYEPFSRVRATPYAVCVTENLNGLDYKSFRCIVASSGLKILTLELMPFAMASPSKARMRRLYIALRAFPLPFIREFLSNFVLFVGERVASRL